MSGADATHSTIHRAHLAEHLRTAEIARGIPRPLRAVFFSSSSVSRRSDTGREGSAIHRHKGRMAAARMALVLVVDDDADNRDTLADVLAEEGYDVEKAAGALEALGMLMGGLRPQLVLLDLVMPGMSGDELLSKLRGSDLAEVPVVVLSARHDWQPPEGVECLHKPVGLATMLEAVRVHARSVSPP
jgi:two-component system response regulator MprA